MQGIEFIPNQPITFEDSIDVCNRSLADCYCQKYQPGDYLKLQLKQVPCAETIICDGTFSAADYIAQVVGAVIDTDCWGADGNAGYYGWLFSTSGIACHIPGQSSDLYAKSNPFTIGKYYKVVITVSSMTDGVLTGDFAGVTFDLSSNGIHTVYFTATATYFTLTTDSDFDGCVSNIESYLLANDVDIILNDIDGVPVASLADFMIYNKDFITVNTKIEEILQQGSGDPLVYGKYQIQVTDPCNENEFTSNCIDYEADHPCTKLIEGICGCSAFGFDFSDNFSLVQRVPMIKFNSRYPAKQEVFTTSTGDLRRVYAERNKIVNAKTDYIDEPAHDCLSTQLLCDILTIDGKTYFYKDSEYKPKWDADGADNLAVAQFEIEAQKKAVIYNTNCGDCDDELLNRNRCVLFGWLVDGSYYKEIHKFQGTWEALSDIEFTIQYARINGIDVLGYSPQLLLTQPSTGVYVPDLIIDEVHNGNIYVGYGTSPNTIVQNVTDWVNGLIGSANLRFLDNMSAVEKSKLITFEVLITKTISSIGSQDRRLYTEAGQYAENDYTNINDAWPYPITPWTECEDI